MADYAAEVAEGKRDPYSLVEGIVASLGRATKPGAKSKKQGTRKA